MRLSVRTALWINQRVRPPSNLSELHGAKLSVAAYQEWEYREIKRIAPEMGPEFDLRGKRVLDVGCGLGGKPCYYAEQGAAQVVGVDIRSASTQAARMRAAEHGFSDCITPLNGDAAHMPLQSDSMDVIISVNVFEHVGDLPGTLAECKRVLKPGGRIFLHFPPFYSPWGAHLEGWLNFPWPNVFFKDRTLLDAAQWIEDQRANNDQYIPSAKVEWARHERLPELNRATVSSFLRLIRETGLTIHSMDLLPFGREYFKNRGGMVGKILLALLRFLARVPLLREMVATKIVFVLSK